MGLPLECSELDLLIKLYVQTAAFGVSILTIVLHVLAVMIAVWAFMKPGGTFRDNAAEATQLLQNEQDTEKKFTINLEAEGGNTTK
jgi:hypothetical protein